MVTRSLPRFLLQAGLLIAVAAIAAVIHLGAGAIVGVMVVAFGVVVLAEWLATREVAERPQRATPAGEPAREPQSFVRSRSAHRTRGQAAPLLRPPGAETAAPVTPPAPEPAPSRAPARPRPRAAPAPAAAARSAAPPRPAAPPAPPKPTREPPQRPAPPPGPPVPAAAPSRPAPIPSRPAAPAPLPAPPEPVPVAAAPSPPPAPIAPPVAERRRWNVFDLQNRARQIAGADSARDEELSFLLLYLREFADVAGDLSEDFDPFIRESFPDLIGTA